MLLACCIMRVACFLLLFVGVDRWCCLLVLFVGVVCLLLVVAR